LCLNPTKGGQAQIIVDFTDGADELLFKYETRDRPQFLVTIYSEFCGAKSGDRLAETRRVPSPRFLLVLRFVRRGDGCRKLGTGPSF
jgi:hypothetical protein